MEKLLKELINELKKVNRDLEKNHKELMNYFSASIQQNRTILNYLIKLGQANGKTE